MLCCETRSCHARRHNDLEGRSNFSNAIYSFSILCFEHHYCGYQQWRSLTVTSKLNPPIAFIYFRWSWSEEFGIVYTSVNFNYLFSYFVVVKLLQ